jgi:hypothetical protein
MADTDFVANETVIRATWANDVNDAVYHAIGNGTTSPETAADVRDNLGLTASSGSSLVGFIQAGTGAGARTMQAKAREIVSANDFFANGASGALVAPTPGQNNSPGIQAAMNAMAAAGGGEVAIMTPGVYEYGSQLVPKNGVVLSGRGRASRVHTAASAVKLSYTGAGSSILIQGPTTTADVKFRGLEIDGLNSSAGASGVVMDAWTNASAIVGIEFEDVIIGNFPMHQIYQNGTVFDITTRNLTLHNYDRAADDLYRVGPNGIPGQITFDNCFLIPSTAGKWAFFPEASCDVRFFGGTVGPNHIDANGLKALGALFLYGTHVEGRGTSTTSIGIQYVGSSGAFISPSQCTTFGTNVQIGDGTANTARGWTIAGCVGAFNAGGGGDIVITAGGERGGTILETGFIGGARTIVDNRLAVDGVAEVAVVDSTFPVIDAKAFTPRLYGVSSAGLGTYSVRRGLYSRHGKRVNFSLWLAWSAHTGTGQMAVDGLPFSAHADEAAPITGFRIETIALGANNFLQAFVSGTPASFALEVMNTGGGAASALAMAGAGSLIVSGSYVCA